MEIECNVYVGKSDDNKIVFIKKVKLAANDPLAKKYSDDYQKIVQFSTQNGYKIRDISQLKEEDYAYLLELIKMPSEEDKVNFVSRK